MAAAPTRDRISASKSRRARQAETKQKLYKAVSHEHSLVAIHEQLAMLTSAIHSLYSSLIVRYWNPFAEEFEPYSSYPSAYSLDRDSGRTAEVTSKPVPHVRSGTEAETTHDLIEASQLISGIGETINCVACWEILPSRYGFEASRFCRQCVVACTPSRHASDSNLAAKSGQGVSRTCSAWESLINQAGRENISSIEFYDSCRLVVASVTGEVEPLLLPLYPQELKVFLEKARMHRIQVKSYLGKKYVGDRPHKDHQTGTGLDEDWLFLQQQLRNVIESMQQQSAEIYDHFLSAERNAQKDQSLRTMPRECKENAVRTVVADTFSRLMSPVSSRAARDALDKYKLNIDSMVEASVQDMFVSVEQDLLKSTIEHKSAGISCRSFPQQMRAKRSTR